MIYSCFVSLVVPVMPQTSLEQLENHISALGETAGKAFSDFEIILVDNRSGLAFDSLSLTPGTRENCYLVQLASPSVWDNVNLAGLERANGDYVVTCSPDIENVSDMIVGLYELSRDDEDIVYVRAGAGAKSPLIRGLFYRLLRLTGGVQVDRRSVGVFLMSRRVVNAVVRDWSATRFLAEAVFGSGYRCAPLEQSVALRKGRRTRAEDHDAAWAALTRGTGLPLLIGQVAVLSMAVVGGLATINAVMVRLFKHNILLQPEPFVPGWAFVVILLSFGFMATNIAIYAAIRILYVLLNEGRTRPAYIVERFGRL